MPRTIQRKFGAELELLNVMTHSELMQILQSAAEEQSMTTSSNENMSNWTLKYDCSCGYEITTPALKASNANFMKIYNVILGVKRELIGQNAINRRCGFHVHIGLGDFANKTEKFISLMNLFRKYENALLAIQAGSRGRVRSNNYCILLRNLNWNHFPNTHSFSTLMDSCPNWDHFHAINLRGSRNHNNLRMEVRYGSGTLRPRKIINWIEILVFLIEYVKNTEEPILYDSDKTIEDLISLVRNAETDTWLDNRRIGLSSWMTRRYQGLNESQNSENESQNNEAA